MVQSLLKNNADVNAKNKNEDTALDVAVGKGHERYSSIIT